MTWTKLPPVEGSVACLTCGAGARTDLDMGSDISCYGWAGYSRDGVTLWECGSDPEDPVWTVGAVENLAAADPDHDWRIFYNTPLWEGEYQRHGPGQWVLIRKGMGFA